MSDLDYSLGEMDRRMGNAVRFGTVSEIDVATGTVRVDLGDLKTGWIPWTTPRAGQDRVWTTPDVGEQVVIVSPGDPSQGVVIGSLFQDASPANGNAGKDRRVTFRDGTVVEFDRDGSVLRIAVPAAGTVAIKVGATELTVTNGSAVLKSSAITLDGDVTITGSTSVQGITSRGVNISSTHRHGGVDPGSGTSGTPT